jgi:two-component system sensor kinase FixL
VVEEAITLSHLRAPDVRVRLRVTLDPKAPSVLVDKVQIQQVVFNLIRNSIDAMQDVSDAEIDIATDCSEAGFVSATFCDTGPGIAPDIMSKLFQPFVTTKEKGMGIGLTICQSIVEAHGGRIWATPNLEKGVCFHFTLPLAEASAGANDG